MELFDLDALPLPTPEERLSSEVLTVVHDWLYFWQAKKWTWDADVFPEIKAAVDRYIERLDA